jgi:HSP20 family molecular chaperone IbpA
MNKNYITTIVNRPLVAGLAALGLGVAIGMAAERSLAPGAKTANSSAAPAGPLSLLSPPGGGAWDPFQEMRDMQAQMDQMFQDSLARFDLDPAFNQGSRPGYSLSLDVRDLKDHYEVRAFLPDGDSATAKVNLTGNELKVEVDNQRSSKPAGNAGPMTATELGHYEQMVQLPGNLKADQMKVAHQSHELVITIPKA